MTHKNQKQIESEERKAARRLRRTRFAWLVARRNVFLTTLPIIIPILLVIIFKYFFPKYISNNAAIVLVVTYCMYLATIFVLSYIIRIIQIFMERALLKLEKRNEALNNSIVEIIKTGVEPLNDKSAVMESVSTAYENTVEKMEQYSKMDPQEKIRAESKGKLSKPEIFYFGAATITPTKKEKIANDQQDEFAVSAIENFFQATEDVKSSDVEITRYVRMFELPSFGRRTSPIRKKYISWIEKQIEAINDNPNYKIIHARRAPRFLSLTSSIIAPGNFISLLGDGKNGFRVVGDEFSRVQLRKSRNFILGDDETGIHPDDVYAHSNLDKLREMLKKLQDFDGNLGNDVMSNDVDLKQLEADSNDS